MSIENRELLSPWHLSRFVVGTKKPASLKQEPFRVKRGSFFAKPAMSLLIYFSSCFDCCRWNGKKPFFGVSNPQKGVDGWERENNGVKPGGGGVQDVGRGSFLQIPTCQSSDRQSALSVSPFFPQPLTDLSPPFLFFPMSWITHWRRKKALL